MGFAVEQSKLREKTVFNVAVLGFEILESEKLVRVRMRCYYGDLEKVECACCRKVASEWGEKEFFYDFKELHIRTGFLFYIILFPFSFFFSFSFSLFSSVTITS